MKKIVLAIATVLALVCFTSCGARANKAEAAEAETEAVDSTVVEAAADTTAAPVEAQAE